MTDKVKLDGKDKKIIEQLLINARQSIADIAKKTKLPRDVVRYRIDRLESTGVVRNYYALIDTSKLGYPLYVYVGFSLLNIEPDEEEQFLKFLKSQKQITYVAKNSGKWDFSIGVAAKYYQDIDNFIREIRKKFSKAIKDFEVTPVIQDYKYNHVTDLI